MDDWDLLARYAQSGDEAAFTRLVERHTPMVFASACRRAGPHKAEDITQAVFVMLTRKMHRISRRRRGTLAGWLFAVTRYAASEALRQERRRRDRVQAAGERQQMIAEEQAGTVDANDVLPLLDAALDSLARKDRDAVILRFFRGAAYAEVGHALGLSENAATKRVARAVEKLRRFFARRDIVLSASGLGGLLASSGAMELPPGLGAALTAAGAASGTAVSAGVAAIAEGTGAPTATRIDSVHEHAAGGADRSDRVERTFVVADRLPRGDQGCPGLGRSGAIRPQPGWDSTGEGSLRAGARPGRSGGRYVMIRRLAMAGAGALCGVVLGTGLSGLPPEAPETDTAALVSDAHGALEEICIHYRADFAPYGSEVCADFFGALGRDVRVRVVVEERADFTALRDTLAARDVPALQRFSPIVTGFPISAWAKDRFGTMSRGGRAVIAVPPARSLPGDPRGNDERVPELLYKRLPDVERAVLPFNFEGGDLLSDDEHVFVAANFLARNAPLDRDGRAQLLEGIGRCFGRRVVAVGTDPAGVPDHHIGMYLTPLGGNTVAAADPDLGLQLLGRDGLSRCGVDVETDPRRYIRFSNVIEQLQDEGMEVVRIPMLLTKTPRVYVTYNNAICERVNGRKRIYMPVYGIPDLDRAATALFEDQGWEVHPVRVESVYGCTGSLRCLVGVIKRSS